MNYTALFRSALAALLWNNELHPEEDVLKLAERHRSHFGFQSFNFFHAAVILAFLYPVLMSAVPPVALSQVAGGSITGTARGDPGSAMPGVQISIKDVTTGQVRTVVTDTSGSYSLPALPAGKYEMTVSVPGFVTQVWTGITVAVGSQRVLNILMRAGSSETVVRTIVSGGSANQSPGNVDNSVVQNTPLNGRGWAPLPPFRGGVRAVQHGSASGGGKTARR